MKFRLILLLFLADFFSCGTVAAQDEKTIINQNQIWLRYFGKIKFNDNWILNVEIEDRRYAFPDRQYQWLLPRANITRNMGKGWDAGIGFVNFRQSLPHDASSVVGLVRPEIRPHQEINYSHGIGNRNSKLSYRYRLEERFIRKSSGNELADGYNFNFRFRYRIQFSCPLIKNEDKSDVLTLKIFDEIFLNFGKQIVYNTFDHNRLGFGLNYRINKDLQFQSDFFNWFQQQSSGDKYYNRYIGRFTLYHSINLYKNKSTI